MTFPAITFTEPGDYNYTLEQAPAADPAHYWADNKKYSVRVKVFVNEEEGDHNGELYVVYSAVDATGKETAVSGEDGKQSEFVFVNSVYEPCIIDPPVLKKVVDANGNVVEDTVGTFVFRMEAIRAGFDECWKTRDFKTIVSVGERLPEAVLQEDPALLMYYDNACSRV